MVKTLAFAAAALLSIAASGCASYVPFTQGLRENNALSGGDLKNLQYYVSTRVVLRRELTSNDRAITPGHKLVLVSGKQVEEVVLEDKTPGVAVGVAGKSIAVSFEPGASLTFAPLANASTTSTGFATAPNPFPGNGGGDDANDSVAVSEDGPYVLVADQPGEVIYEGKPFHVVEGLGEAALVINAEALDKVATTRKVVQGMRLK